MVSNSIILRHARDLITPPEAWTRQRYARDVKGNFVSVYSKHAVAFDMESAILRQIILIRGASEVFCEKIVAEVLGIGVNDLTQFNDTHTHAEVLQALDDSIAKALELQSGIEEPFTLFDDIAYCDKNVKDVEPELEEGDETAPEAIKKTRKPRTKKEAPQLPVVEEIVPVAPVSAPVVVVPVVDVPSGFMLGEFFE